MRRLQFIVAAAVGVLAITDILVGSGAVDVGSDGLVALLSDRLDVTMFGATLLASMVASLLWPRWRQLQAKFFFVGSICVLMLASAEGAARLVGYIPAPSHPNRTYWTTDPELGFVCRKNCTFRYLATDGWISGSTDSTGYRPVLTARDTPEDPTIICVGDSTTFCGETEDDKTWPEAAAHYLQDHGRPHRMLNRGIYGYSGLQSLLTMRRVLRTSGNYRAVIYHFCFNDPRENLVTTLPCPVLASDDSHFTVKPPSDQMIAQLAARHRPETALQTAFRSWRFSIDEAAFRSGGDTMYRLMSVSYERFSKDQLEQEGMRYVIARMKEECDRHHLPLLVSAVNYPFFDADGPARQELMSLLKLSDMTNEANAYYESFRCLKQIAEECGAGFIDIRDCLKDMGIREYIVSPIDWHFSAAANRRIGEAIARQLEDRIR